MKQLFDLDDPQSHAAHMQDRRIYFTPTAIGLLESDEKLTDQKETAQLDRALNNLMHEIAYRDYSAAAFTLVLERMLCAALASSAIVRKGIQ